MNGTCGDCYYWIERDADLIDGQPKPWVCKLRHPKAAVRTCLAYRLDNRTADEEARDRHLVIDMQSRPDPRDARSVPSLTEEFRLSYLLGPKRKGAEQ